MSRIVDYTGAFAGINGGFFAGDGGPLGLLYIGGQLLSEPVRRRSVVAITEDMELFVERPTFEPRVKLEVPDSAQPAAEEVEAAAGEWSLAIDGVNRARGQDELILYNQAFGRETGTNIYGQELVVRGGRVVARRTGPGPVPYDGYVLSGHGEMASALSQVPVDTRVVLEPGLPEHWDDLGVEHALGAGPQLVREGSIHVTGQEEDFRPSFIEGRHPRTAIGRTDSGEILMLSVNGRNHSLSTGLTLHELAELMLERGAVEAVNLDGGGSTTLLFRDRIINIPSDGSERGIASALILLES